MRILFPFLALAAAAMTVNVYVNSKEVRAADEYYTVEVVAVPPVPTPVAPSNNCVSFTLGAGTGCAWMCEYCADQLDTNNYYFTDGVCTYEQGGCVGNPAEGHTYTCCAV
jgi:hypothetical protein